MAVSPATKRLIETAWRVGCAPDQLQNFLSAGYCPQPKQLELHAAARLCDELDGPDQIGFGGARGPGKSHGVFAQVALDDARRFDGCKVLYLRKVAKQAREQFDDLARRVLANVPYKFNRNAGVVNLWNDSRIFIGHFNNESDIDHYLGIEYDIIVIEEATTLSQSKYKALRDSNRTSKAGMRPRIYLTTNPGGIGHTWFKSRFLDPWRKRQETYTRFIPATVDDNLFVDEGYTRRLEENVGWKLRAYRYGDWDIAAGQFFTNWRHDMHVIQPFDIPLDWRVWLALDYGFTHPTVAILFAMDGDGNAYVVDEHRQSKWLVPRHAEAITAMLGRRGVTKERLMTIVAGSDVFAERGTTSRTIAEEYRLAGYELNRADNDRINGAGRLLQLLGDSTAGQMPRLFVFDRCAALIECLPAMEHDPGRPEDVLKVDVDEDGNGGDDAYDACRYGVMAVNSATSFVIPYR